MNKKKAALLNMISMAIYQFIVALMGFIIPKLLLEKFGAEIHGYTSTVLNIMSYVSLLNAGLGTASIQALYKPLAKKDYKELNSILNTIDKFYTKTGVMYTIAISLISLFLPFVIKSNISNFEIIILMIIMGGTSTLECFIYSKYMVLLQADQHLYVVNITNAISTLIRMFLQIFLLQFDVNVIFIQLIPLLLVVFRTYLLHLYIIKNYSYLDKTVKTNNESLSKRWNAFAHQIAGLVVNNTDVVLLTLFTNLTYVSIYSVYNLVFSHLYTLMTNVFSNGIVASFGVSIQEENEEKTIKAFEMYELIYYIAVVIVYSITACMILPFVKLYTANITNVEYVNIRIAILFIIISIMNNLRVPCGTMISAAGHFKETQYRAILEAVINIVISLILVKPFGIYGLLIGTICSFLYRTFDIIIYSNKHILKRKVSKTIKRLMLVVINLIANILLYKLFFKDNIVNSWIDWIFKSSIVGIISICTSMIIFYIFEKEYFEKCIKVFHTNFIRKRS